LGSCCNDFVFGIKKSGLGSFRKADGVSFLLKKMRKRGIIMALLSYFRGLYIRMHEENDGKHHAPHIHAEYNGEEGVFDLNGDLIAGYLPLKQSRMIAGWVAAHEDELRENWELIARHEPHYKILGM
jgi:hypothetical protein